jgi:hypothetical protein
MTDVPARLSAVLTDRDHIARVLDRDRRATG